MALDEWDPKRGRGGRHWRRIVAEVCPPGSLCEVPECTKTTRQILFGLRPNHPMGPSVDHIMPLHQGGHPTARWNLRPAHFGCNAGRRREEQPATPRRSRAALSITKGATSRTVVLLVGPPGAGKTTAARASGLEVFDRDDPQWSSERQFTSAIGDLASRPAAHAVVIRTAPTSTARARWARLTDATAVYVIATPRDVCEARIRERRRTGYLGELAAAAAWFGSLDRADRVEDFPGWEAVVRPPCRSRAALPI